MEAIVRYLTFEPGGGTYTDLLTTNLNFAESPELAALYGAEPWDGVSAPQPFPQETRSGLLTRAAMLISSNHETNPFKRGAFVRRRLTCVPVSPPANLPADALTPPPFDPTASTRERFAQKVTPLECAGCHKSFTPFGYALEAYDGLGRYRTDERIIDEDGGEIRTVPVDTSVEIEIIPGQPELVNDAVEMSAALAANWLADECFARQYFRYTFRRRESVGDECILGGILQNLRETYDGEPGSLKHAMLEVALQDAFKNRIVE
jgi:hypothetical protein